MDIGQHGEAGLSPTLQVFISVYQHTTSCLQFGFSARPYFLRLPRAHCITLHGERAQWVLREGCLECSLLVALTNHPKCQGKATTILLYYPVGQDIGQSAAGMDCPALWFGRMWQVELTQAELSWDRGPEDVHTASPCGLQHVVLRGSILRWKDRVQGTAVWHVWPSLGGHVASLSPNFIDQSSHKCTQIQGGRDLDITSRGEVCLRVWVPCFKTAMLNKTRRYIYWAPTMCQIFTSSQLLWRYYYYFHFTAEEIGSERLRSLCKVPQP